MLITEQKQTKNHQLGIEVQCFFWLKSNKKVTVLGPMDNDFEMREPGLNVIN